MLIINFFIMLNLALTTLPLYPLAVLLGSELGDTHVRHEPLRERLHKIFGWHASEQVSDSDPPQPNDKDAPPLAAAPHGLCHVVITAPLSDPRFPGSVSLMLVHVSAQYFGG